MKRPHIALKVRLAVLERQAFIERKLPDNSYRVICRGQTIRAKIQWLILTLFGHETVELDHDPALQLRRFNKRTGRYSPDANNPKYLIYRVVPEHLRKTIGRTPGAERTVTMKGSDAWLAKKFRKLEHPKESKSRIPSRPFRKAKRRLWSRTSLSATRAVRGS